MAMVLIVEDAFDGAEAQKVRTVVLNFGSK